MKVMFILFLMSIYSVKNIKLKTSIKKDGFDYSLDTLNDFTEKLFKNEPESKNYYRLFINNFK